MLRYIATVLSAVLLVYVGYAQKPQIDLDKSDDLFDRYAMPGSIAMRGGGYYVIEKTTLPCHAAEHAFSIVRSLAHHLLIARFPDGQSPSAQYPCIKRYAPANERWKFSPALERLWAEWGSKRPAMQRFVMTASNIQQLLADLPVATDTVEVIAVQAAVQSAVIRCSPQFLANRLLPHPLLLFVDAQQVAQPEILLTGYDKSSHAINATQFFFPFVNGRNVVVGIKERSMNATDIDLQRRVLPSILASPEVELHATSIATLVGGAGNSFYTGRGLASRCSFYPTSFNNLFPDSTNLLLQQRVNIQNHSYGTTKQQFYGAEAAAYDVQAFAQPNLLHVFSSGNRGTEAGAPGLYNDIPGFANITGNFKMAKNVITVAALDTNTAVAAFSSAGPLHDGRLGPQLAAFGLNGTSDAAALVTGTATLLHQSYKDSNAQSVPAAALVKALMYNTADDVASPGIDYRTGFGAINVQNALTALLKKQYASGTLAQGATWTHTLVLPPQAANLKVTLSWTDTAAGVNNSLALVNDLDLELVELNTGTVYRPWCLNPSPQVDSLKQWPVRKRDSLNTAEQVSIALPAAGQYQLRIRAFRIQTQLPQPFHVAWGWDTLNRFLFTSPQQAEDISLDERDWCMVRWKTVPADANATGNLSVSYNGGAQWQPIATGIPLAPQQYKWLVRDTAAVARLKMDCAFGSFESLDFVIARFPHLRVDFVCPDSVGITWQRYPFATAYQLLALPTDSAYLQPVTLLTDTATVLKGSLLAYNIFAIRPVLGNGLPAAQSLAIGVRNQAIKCFYTDFGAINTGPSVSLNLVLSTTKGIDSIVFERVIGNAGNVQTIRAAKVAPMQLTYSANDLQPLAGLNVYRVRLVFADRRIAYTEPASIVHTGSRKVYFYPNPVAASANLLYQLKDDQPGWQLQLTDMAGRLIQTQPLNFAGTVKIYGLLPGVYVYRLLNPQNSVQETGKIVIAK